jgi:GT2 family glycosyltransferase
MENDYSVIIIGYKSLENIKNRLNECYNGQNPPTEFILIINHYSDISLKILEYAKTDSRITRFVYCSQNIGFAKAINLGFKISKCPKILMLSDDCSVNQNTCFSLISCLKDNYGISTILAGGRSHDIIPMPQGFILGLRKDVIEKIGGYIYDEAASPLGDEIELTYRIKYHGYDLFINNSLYFNHYHDISNNPTTMINYLGEMMSPRGEKAFQFEQEKQFNSKIENYKKLLLNGNHKN